MWVCVLLKEHDSRERYSHTAFTFFNVFSIQEIVALTSKEMTSVLPALKAWLAPTISTTVACLSGAVTCFTSSKVPSSSLVPCRNNIGTFTCFRCSALSVDGLPEGWSGNPKKTIPLISCDGCVDKYWELILPPKDFPDRKTGSSGKSSLAFCTAASMVFCATSGESGLPFLFSLKGKLNLNVAMPDSANVLAI